MKMPIPQDYEPESGLTCFQINWPDTPYWIGILQGLITSIQLGRIWDEKTGSIIGVQAIGKEIERANLPLTLCNGGSAGDQTDDDASRVIQFVSGSMLEHIFGVDEMTLCGYNPKAFKIENGTLFVRDFCGDWVSIGSVGYGSSAFEPDAPPIDPMPEGLGSATACTKATQVATILYNIVQAAFNSADVEDFLWGWYGFADTIRSQVAGINFGDNDLYNMFYQIYVLEIAGLENETEDPIIIEHIKCMWEPALSDGPQGITADEYEAMKPLLSTALRNAIGDSEYEGFGRTMRFAWERAFSAIGAKDIEKITQNLISTGLEDCTCPDIDSYDGVLRFSGVYDAPQHPEWVNSVVVGDNGRYVDISWTTPPGFSKNEDSFKLFLNVSGSVTDFVLKVSALNGNVPLNSQTTEEYCGNPDYWTQPGIIWTPVDVDTWTTLGGARYNYTHFTSPAVADVTMDSYFCDCPSNQTGDNKTYNFRYELVQVNGVDVG